MKKYGLIVISFATFLLLATCFVRAQTTATLTVDPGTTFQTISGWEATAQAGQLECNEFDNYKVELFDRAVNELGINRIRLELRSGSENPVDYYSQLLAGQISYSDWKSHWHEIINDNGDPNTINPGGFQFSELEHSIDTVIMPLRQRLAANGETLYVNLTVVDFSTNQGSSNVQYQSDPDEYAELILAAFQHMDQNYGFVPDAVEVILEPDVAQWGNGTNVGNALAAAGARLQAAGYTPDFVAPSNTNMGAAVNWFDQLIQVPNVTQFITDISYHRYGGVSDSNLQAIASRATQYDLDTGMLEHIGSGYEDLHKDLAIAQNSSWQQFVLAFCTNDDGAQYYWVDQSSPGNPAVNMASRTRFLRQYFKFIRADAVRVGAGSNDNALEPLAFINQDGGYVVVVKANGGRDFVIQGLPAGTYGIKYTTQNEYDIDLPDVTIGAGQDLTANIPAQGVITIYAKSGSPSQPPASVTIDGPTDGLTGWNHRFDATVSPVSATQPITYVWQATDKSPVTHVGDINDAVTFRWNTEGIKTVTVTTSNEAGIVMDTHTITIAEPDVRIYLPVIRYASTVSMKSTAQSHGSCTGYK